MSEVADNITAIREKIRKSAEGAGRAADSVTLVAVSKMQPEGRVAAALAAGQRCFGENRVQEAQARWSRLKEQYPDIVLHLIGPLQTNKAAEAVALFDCIETVDREKLAARLASEMARQKRRLPCFIEVNSGAEPQKAGVLPEETEAFYRLCTDKYGLDIKGLMCIPPADEPPGPHFALLQKLGARLGLPHLSMGMSADFEKAIALGATHVRIGTALFGERAG